MAPRRTGRKSANVGLVDISPLFRPTEPLSAFKNVENPPLSQIPFCFDSSSPAGCRPFQTGPSSAPGTAWTFLCAFPSPAACPSTPPGAYWKEAMPTWAARLFRVCCAGMPRLAAAQTNITSYSCNCQDRLCLHVQPGGTAVIADRAGEGRMRCRVLTLSKR